MITWFVLLERTQDVTACHSKCDDAGTWCLRRDALLHVVHWLGYMRCLQLARHKGAEWHAKEEVSTSNGGFTIFYCDLQAADEEWMWHECYGPPFKFGLSLWVTGDKTTDILLTHLGSSTRDCSSNQELASYSLRMMSRCHSLLGRHFLLAMFN